MPSKSGVWGWERERLRRGQGECGKEPHLTRHVLDSPRLPVSHPQTRSHRPTGVQARAASHTDTHGTDAQSHTGTKTHIDAYPNVRSQTHKHRVSHRHSGIYTRGHSRHTSHTHTQKHANTVTHAHTLTVHTHTHESIHSPQPSSS